MIITLQLKNYNFIIGNGNSMIPTYTGYTFLIVDRNLEPELNDIVFYKYNDMLLCHRFIDIEQDNFVMKGDNNSSCEYISEDDVVGTVVYDLNLSLYILI